MIALTIALVVRLFGTSLERLDIAHLKEFEVLVAVIPVETRNL